MIKIVNITVYDDSKNLINFCSAVNLMNDELRTSIGWVGPQELFDTYKERFLEKYGEKWDYTSAVIAADTIE